MGVRGCSGSASTVRFAWIPVITPRCPVSAVRRKAVALNASERCRNINLHFVTVVLSIQFSPLSSVTNKRCFGIASRASSCLKTFT